MSRRANLVNNILSLVITVSLAILVVRVADGKFYADMGTVFLYVILGAIVSGFFSTLFHELGHVVVGVINGFKIITFKILFIKLVKKEKGYNLSFAFFTDEAGATESVPTRFDNLPERFKKMSLGGIISSFILMLLGVIPLFLTEILSIPLFFIWSMFLPIGAYFFFGNALPMVNEGYRNDGAMIYGIKTGDDESKVIISLLKIQGEMYLGKTPSEIDEKLYFDLPQLQEDSPYFISLLNARYNYYVDKGDYSNAEKVTERLLSLEEYMPKNIRNIVYADALYNYCTFSFDEDKADDFSYEIENYLNKNNTLTNLRVKLAYILYVRREKEFINDFYKKAIEEADKCQIKGLSAFEIKLLNKMKENFDK